VVPITGSISSRQTTSGTTGYDYGSSDGETTCENIVAAIQAGQLVLPSDQPVMVYRDIEQGTDIMPAYWAGWATAVDNYTYNGLAPFNPGIYTYYVKQANGLYSPQSSVQTCLNTVCEYWPDAEYLCYGLWANEPEPCSYCDPSAVPDWSVFNAFTQTGCGNKFPVPLHLYQYAERPGCINTCGVSNFAGGQNVDLDGSDGTQGTTYMLVIA
jgi:hypothetical protein